MRHTQYQFRHNMDNRPFTKRNYTECAGLRSSWYYGMLAIVYNHWSSAWYIYDTWAHISLSRYLLTNGYPDAWVPIDRTNHDTWCLPLQDWKKSLIVLNAACQHKSKNCRKCTARISSVFTTANMMIVQYFDKFQRHCNAVIIQWHNMFRI